MGHRVLVIDDEPQVLKALDRFMRGWGFEVEALSDPRVALNRIAVQDFDAVLTDYSMPLVNGLDVLRAVNEHQPACPTIILTAYASVERAVEAMRIGAFDFLAKPIESEELRKVMERAVCRQRQPRVANSSEAARILLGDSEPIRSLRALIADVADTDSTVLITGESGTGKELVARALHEGSSRASRAFIPVHSGAIPESLLESEMFGHVKGAFTGATQARAGRFELADGGTLFLDEIGEMPLSLQVKLLRVLQERCFEPVGSSRTVRVDLRVLAATNKDLEHLVETGQFRADLFYRLNVVPIVVPPLRERREDIPILANHFLARYREARRSAVTRFSGEAMSCLMACDWPGNVRELENLVERLVILKRQGVIEVSDLPERYRSGRTPPAPALPPVVPELPETGLDLRKVLAEYEEELVRQALERSKGNKNRAAALLGINRTTLVEKLKRMPSLRGRWIDGPGRSVDADGSADGAPEPSSEERGPRDP